MAETSLRVLWCAIVSLAFIPVMAIWLVIVAVALTIGFVDELRIGKD